MSIQAAAVGSRVSEPAARARAFVDEILIPREVAAERAGGRLPGEKWFVTYGDVAAV